MGHRGGAHSLLGISEGTPLQQSREGAGNEPASLTGPQRLKGRRGRCGGSAGLRPQAGGEGFISSWRLSTPIKNEPSFHLQTLLKASTPCPGL